MISKQTFDIANASDLLHDGPNVLAFQALNRDRSDADFLLAPELVAYPKQSSFQVTETSQVKARVVVGDVWSAVTEASFSLAVPADSNNLRISEIHYHPADPSPAETQAGFSDGDEFEFLELVNISDQPVDLSDVRLRQVEINGELQGVSFDFATSQWRELAPGQHVVVVENQEAFEARYGSELPIAGQWVGGLSNASETVLLTAGGETIHQFAYSDAWFPVTDGNGPSLERIDPTAADLDLWASAAAWRPSALSGGTPGRDGGYLPGDANRDGVFDSADLVLALQASEFEDQVSGNSSWEEGDWDGDGDFTTRDLVLAFEINRFVPPNASFIANAVDAALDDPLHDDAP